MKKKLFKKIFLSIIIMLLFTLVSTTIFAFNSETHLYTTQQGMSIISNTFEDEITEFYDEKSQADIFTYCVQPDFDENTGVFKWHFYSPATQKNFIGEKTSALTKFITHYNDAINNYRLNHVSRTWEELGRALHFIEDINTPVHSNAQILIDATFQVPMHKSFENLCVKVQEQHVANMSQNEFIYYKINSLEKIAKSSSYMANDNYFAIFEYNIISKEQGAGNAIINAQKAVAGLLYKFYLDISYINKLKI